MKSEEIDAAGSEEKMNEEDGRSMAAVHITLKMAGRRMWRWAIKIVEKKWREDCTRRSCGEEFVEYWREVAH